MYLDRIQNPSEIFGKELAIGEKIWIIQNKHLIDSQFRFRWTKGKEICEGFITDFLVSVHPRSAPYVNDRPVPFWFVNGYVKWPNYIHTFSEQPLIECYKSRERAELELQTGGCCAPVISENQLIEKMEGELDNCQVLPWALYDLINYEGEQRIRLRDIPDILQKGANKKDIQTINGIPFVGFRFITERNGEIEAWLYWKNVVRVCFQDPETMVPMEADLK